MYGLIVLETAKLPFNLSDELKNHQLDPEIVQKSFEFFLENEDYFRADMSAKFEMPIGKEFGWTEVLDEGLLPYFNLVKDGTA